jgi:hypothetical protein
MKSKTRKAQQPSYDPYSSYGVDDSRGWVGPLPVKVVSVLDLTEDVHRSAIRRGMRVLEPAAALVTYLSGSPSWLVPPA